MFCRFSLKKSQVADVCRPQTETMHKEEHEYGQNISTKQVTFNHTSVVN